MKPLMYIVEDSLTWQEIFKENLSKEYNLKLFQSGEAMLEALQTETPKFILQDHDLHEGGGTLSGKETIKQAQKVKPGVYIIMISAQDDIQVAVDVLQLGAHDYVIKPKDGSNVWLKRLGIILRNIERAEAASSKVLELKLSIQRWKLALYGLVGFIAVSGSIIYLNQCPNNRPIKWDPFNVESTNRCNPETAQAK